MYGRQSSRLNVERRAIARETDSCRTCIAATFYCLKVEGTRSQNASIVLLSWCTPLREFDQQSMVVSFINCFRKVNRARVSSKSNGDKPINNVLIVCLLCVV